MSIRRRNTKKSPQLAINEHELDAMTAEVDHKHQAELSAMRVHLDSMGQNMLAMVRKPSTRRTFLLGSGGALTLGAVVACGDDDDDSDAGSTATSQPDAGGGTYPGDLKVVALAAALENLAVTAYDGALTKATNGDLGEVPPAVATFVQTARQQHADMAAAWNGVLTGAGKPPITDAPLSITEEQVAMLQAARSVPDVATLARNLEKTASQTYVFAVANVTDAGGIATASAAGPVANQRAAILNFVLGAYPVPDTFQGTDMAVPPDALQVG